MKAAVKALPRETGINVPRRPFASRLCLALADVPFQFTFGGPSTAQEMCFNFLMFYPLSAGSGEREKNLGIG